MIEYLRFTCQFVAFSVAQKSHEFGTIEILKSTSFCFSLLWCHQKTSFISKWLYIFVLKNFNKRNLPLLLHLISAPFCSVSQSRVPTLMQR